jgi:tripartite-type tricarboxylate transporter receptor subunit TctC
MRRTTTGLACFAAVAAAMAAPAFGQNYPVKPIRLIIAQAPGSASDVIARLIGNKLYESMGQTVIIDARPGAGGVLGTEVAARSAPDGYTLMIGNNSSHGANPALYEKLPFDAVKDFAPIIYFANTGYLLCVHPSLPVKNVKELIALAKAKPGQLNYGSPGNGSTHQLSSELLKLMTGINIVHVPYKGTTPAITALISGEVQILFSTITAIQPHIKAGKVKALGIASLKRSNMMPGLPTIAETLPGFEMLSWYVLLAPAKTPPAIVTKLNGEMNKILQMPDLKAAINNQGFDVLTGGTPEEAGEFIKRDIEKNKKVVKAANIKID